MNMIMKIIDIRRLSMLAAAVIFFAGCEKDAKVQPSIDGLGGVLSVTSAVIDPLGGDVDLIIAADADWRIYNKPNWLTIDIEAGKAGTAKVNISASANNSTGKDRNCELKFLSGNFQENITISQECPKLEVIPVSDNDDKRDDGGLDIPFKWFQRQDYSENFKVEVRSNIPWTFDCETMSGTKAPEDGSVRYDELLRAGSSPEWARYVMALAGDRIDQWVNVYHTMKNGSLERIVGNGDYTGDHKFEFIPYMENTGEEDASVIYRVIPADNSGLETIDLRFTQDNLVFTIDATAETLSEKYDAAKMEPKSFVVNCERPWRLTNRSETNPVSGNAADWLLMKYDGGSYVSLNQEVSSGVKQLQIEALVNDMRLERFGSLFLTMEAEDITISKEISLCQKEFVLDLSLNSGAESIELRNNDAGVYEAAVRSSGTWEIKSKPEWLVVETLTCEGGTIVSGTVDETVSELFRYNAVGQNFNNRQDLTGELIIGSTQNDLTVAVPVTQAKFEWNIALDDSEPSFGARNSSSDKSLDFDILCSSPWEVLVEYPQSGPSGWLTIPVMSGTVCEDTPKNVIFYANNQNKSEDRRYATVTVRSIYYTENADLQKTFTVFQRGINFGLTKSEEKAINRTFGEYQASNQTIEVMSSHPWSVKSYPSWAVVSASGTEDDGQIVISVSDNLQMSERDGRIVLESPELARECTINLTQSPFRFNIDRNSFTGIPAYVNSSSSYTASLDNSAGWSCSRVSGGSWVALPADNGAENITFDVQTNTGEAARECTLRFYSAAGNYMEDVTFSQAGYQFRTTASSSYSFEPLDSQPVSFNVTCSGPWKVRNLPTWATVTPSSDAGGGNESAAQTVTITASSNNTTIDQTKTIEVYSEVGSYSKSIALTLKKYNWSPGTITTTSVDALSPGTATFYIASSGNWSITSNDPSWISINGSTSISGDATTFEYITVSFEENYNPASRTAQITVRSTEPGINFSNTHTVTQKAFVFDTAAETLSFANVPESSQYFYLESGTMSTWKVSSKNSWIKPVTTSGTGAGRVEIEVDPNTDLTSRTGTVEIVSDKNASLKKVVTIKQDAFEFTSTAVTLDFASKDTSTKTVSVVCAGDWQINGTVPTWLTISPKTGTGNRSVSFKVAENTGAARKAELTLVSKLDSKHTRKITVNQAAKPAE